MWRRIVSSKKTIAMISGVVFSVIVVPIADALGVEVSVDQVYQVVAIIVGYLIGQGFADSGKEATKIAVANAVPVTGVRTLVDPTDATPTTRELPLVPAPTTPTIRLPK